MVERLVNRRIVGEGRVRRVEHAMALASLAASGSTVDRYAMLAGNRPHRPATPDHPRTPGHDLQSVGDDRVPEGHDRAIRGYLHPPIWFRILSHVTGRRPDGPEDIAARCAGPTTIEDVFVALGRGEQRQ